MYKSQSVLSITVSTDQPAFSLANADSATVGLANDTIVIAREFDPNFAHKYKGSEFIYESSPPVSDVWDRMMMSLAQWIDELFQFTDPKVAMDITLGTVRIVAIAVVIGVVYLIVKALLNREGQWIFGQSSKRTPAHIDIENNIHTTDFEKLIGQALQSGDRRLGIRYHYLWLLRRLSERGTIAWDPEKTNSDYLYEIQNATLKAEFEYLSYLYNYIWYGEFELDDQMFVNATLAFEKSIPAI